MQSALFKITDWLRFSDISVIKKIKSDKNFTMHLCGWYGNICRLRRGALIMVETSTKTNMKNKHKQDEDNDDW